MRVIPLTSILSHKGRGSHFHPSVALHLSMETRNDMVIREFRYHTNPCQFGSSVCLKAVIRGQLESIREEFTGEYRHSG